MRRAVLAFAVASSVAVLPVAAAPDFTKSSDYIFAANDFNERHDLRERVVAQVLLITTGHQNSVPTERLTTRTYLGMRQFQAETGVSSPRMLDETVQKRQLQVASPLLATWDFRVIAHPTRGTGIWMPTGLGGMQRLLTKTGISFQDSTGRLKANYNYFPGARPEIVYADLLEKMRYEGHDIHYSVIKDGWFVISTTSPKGEDEYVRYHQDGAGLLGFTLFWNNDRGNVSGERVAILMSASLGSAMNGRPFIDPPVFNQSAPPPPPVASYQSPDWSGRVEAPTPPAVQQQPSYQPVVRNEGTAIAPVAPVIPPVTAPVTPAIPVPRDSKGDENRIQTGSGFFVDAKGTFVTNHHVVADCKTVIVKLTDGRAAHKARVLATDITNDLALLAVEEAGPSKFATLRLGARLGEGVAAFGYPHSDVLASSGNFTLGNVTALAGIGDDSRYYQVSAPVQSGNSGGPLLDNYGNAIGVVTAKLNVVRMAAASGDFAQNVNFAIKSTMLATFLDSNQITIVPGTTTGTKLDPADLADVAKAMSGFVACQ